MPARIKTVARIRGAVFGQERDGSETGNPSGRQPQTVRDEARYQYLIAELARLGAHLVQRGCRLRLFSSDIWFDSKAIADLEEAIKRRCNADEADLITCTP